MGRVRFPGFPKKGITRSDQTTGRERKHYFIRESEFGENYVNVACESGRKMRRMPQKTALNSRLMFFLLIYAILGPGLPNSRLVSGQYSVKRSDPFALLSATLQTYQEAACDNQVLSMECPRGTKISIELVQYGRSAPSDQVRTRRRSDGVRFHISIDEGEINQRGV